MPRDNANQAVASPLRYNRVILDRVKTAISIPDDTFSEVEKRAQALGMSRSEFYTVAARAYLRELDERSVTSEIDEALALSGPSDDSAKAAAAAGRRRLADSDGDDW